MLLLPKADPDPVCEEGPELSKAFRFFRAPCDGSVSCKVFLAVDGTEHRGHAVEMRFDNDEDDPIERQGSYLGSPTGYARSNSRDPTRSRSNDFFPARTQTRDKLDKLVSEDDDNLGELREFRKTVVEEKEVISGEKIIKRCFWNHIYGVVALPQSRGGYWLENRSALLNEYRVLKRITEAESTPAKNSIIRIVAAIVDTDTPRVITELVRPLGYDMSLVIRKHASYDLQQRETAFMPETELCGYLIQVIGATNFLHASGIVHRDLKPENVLITDRVHVFDEVRRVNQIRIIDFGCAAILNADGTCRERLMRSAINIAPEVLRRLPHGKQVDAYGIGHIVDRAAFQDSAGHAGNLQLEPWVKGLMVEDPEQRWTLEELSERINERLLSQEKERPFHSQLNALGMIIKIEGMIAEALLGEVLQPRALMDLGLRTKGLHVVFASSAEKLTNPGGKDLVKNGDRILAIVDPNKGESARPKDLRNILGVSSDEGKLRLSSRTLEANNVLPCFVEFDEVEMPQEFFRESERTQHGRVVCILGPKALPSCPYLSQDEKENLRQEHADKATDSIVVVYLDLQRKLSGFNVSGIARSGIEGDEYIWPDPKLGIIDGDRLLLARFDSSNVGSSKSMFDVENLRDELLKLATDVEMEVARPLGQAPPAFKDDSPAVCVKQEPALPFQNPASPFLDSPRFQESDKEFLVNDGLVPFQPTRTPDADEPCRCSNQCVQF